MPALIIDVFSLILVWERSGCGASLIRDVCTANTRGAFSRRPVETVLAVQHLLRRNEESRRFMEAVRFEAPYAGGTCQACVRRFDQAGIRFHCVIVPGHLRTGQATSPPGFRADVLADGAEVKERSRGRIWQARLSIHSSLVSACWPICMPTCSSCSRKGFRRLVPDAGRTALRPYRPVMLPYSGIRKTRWLRSDITVVAYLSRG
jgi:hypothetical protein